jgi:hypothetical protein
MRLEGLVVAGGYVGPCRRESSTAERRRWREERGMNEESGKNGNGGPTVRLSLSGMTQALALTAILAAASYVWATLQHVPDPEVIKALQADVAQAKLESVRTSAEMTNLAANMQDIKAQLAEIQRLLRMRPKAEGGDR